jgi:hypothetical protein
MLCGAGGLDRRTNSVANSRNISTRPSAAAAALTDTHADQAGALALKSGGCGGGGTDSVCST